MMERIADTYFSIARFTRNLRAGSEALKDGQIVIVRPKERVRKDISPARAISCSMAPTICTKKQGTSLSRKLGGPISLFYSVLKYPARMAQRAPRSRWPSMEYLGYDLLSITSRAHRSNLRRVDFS